MSSGSINIREMLADFVLHTIGTKPFEAAGVMITPIRVMHAKLPILGLPYRQYGLLDPP